MNGNQIAMLLQQEMQHLPRVQGARSAIPHRATPTRYLMNAEDIAKKMGDEFVSVEPILLAILKGNSTAARILKDAGANEKDLHRCHSGFATGTEREEPECRRQLSES